MISFDFSGRNIVVTGGASGIGKCVAEQLVASGAKVFVLDRTESSVQDATSFPCDVRDEEALVGVFAKISEQVGMLHGVVQCAGVTRDAVFWKLAQSDWEMVLDVNLKGAFLVMKHAMPLLRAADSGAIVNLSSINGLRGKFGQANYAASKAGLIGLSKTAAKEAGHFGIRVNVIAPGLVLTPLIEELPEEVKKKSVEESSLGRASRPEDIASAAMFLLSDQARQITGEVLKVDGGQYI